LIINTGIVTDCIFEVVSMMLFKLTKLIYE
jgi:hypothetical protein